MLSFRWIQEISTNVPALNYAEQILLWLRRCYMLVMLILELVEYGRSGSVHVFNRKRGDTHLVLQSFSHDRPGTTV